MARLRELSNYIENINPKDYSGEVLREATESLVHMFNPVIPHITEELWKVLGHTQPLVHRTWPQAHEELLIEDTVQIAVQVSGKLRGTLKVAAGSGEDTVKTAALELPNVQNAIATKDIRKVIFVADKIINLVV